MKKYAIIGSIWLIAIAAWFGVWWTQQQRIFNGSVLFEVPAVYDQLLYAFPDKDMLEGLEKVWHLAALSGTEELLNSTRQLAVWQYVTNAQEPLVLLFLDVLPDFSFDRAQQMGILATGDGVRYERIENNRYVYGDEASLAYYHTQQSGSVLDTEIGKEFIQTFTEKNAHIGFLSQPASLLEMQKNVRVQQFAQKLEWTFARSRLSAKEQQWEITLRFKESMVKAPLAPFVPKLADDVGENVGVYIEMHDLLWLFGVSETQVTSLLPLLVQQAGGVYANLLWPDDRATLASVARWNIWITFAPVEGVPWAALRIQFSDKAMYTTLQKLAPFVSGLLEGYAGAGAVRTEKWQNIQRWSIVLGGTGWMNVPVLTMSQTWSLTQIDIVWTFVPSIEQKPVRLQYTTTSFVSFMLRSDVVQQLLTSISPAWVLSGEPQAIPLGSGSTVYGEVHTDAGGKEIVLSFSSQ